MTGHDNMAIHRRQRVASDTTTTRRAAAAATTTTRRAAAAETTTRGEQPPSVHPLHCYAHTTSFEGKHCTDYLNPLYFPFSTLSLVTLLPFFFAFRLFV